MGNSHHYYISSSFPGYRELTQKKALPSLQREARCASSLHGCPSLRTQWGTCHREWRSALPTCAAGSFPCARYRPRRAGCDPAAPPDMAFLKKKGILAFTVHMLLFLSVSTNNTALPCKTRCCKEQADKLHLKKKSHAEDKQHPQSVQEQQVTSVTTCASQNNVRMLAMHRVFNPQVVTDLSKSTCLRNILHSNATEK